MQYCESIFYEYDKLIPRIRSLCTTKAAFKSAPAVSVNASPTTPRLFSVKPLNIQKKPVSAIDQICQIKVEPLFRYSVSMFSILITGSLQPLWASKTIGFLDVCFYLTDASFQKTPDFFRNPVFC